jgi:hypothetical protein
MRTLSREQKIILAVLAILDVVVIGGMAAVVIRSMTTTPASPLPTATSAPTSDRELQPTWTPTTLATARPTLPPRPTNTPTATPTVGPTQTPTAEPPTPTPVPPGPVPIPGADFDFILPNRIPGWKWDAYVNYKEGDEDYSPDDSYAEPVFRAADDPARQIDGSTLKVETIRWLKFRAWVHQTVTVTAGSTVYFQIKAQAFSSLDRLMVKAGVDPTGVGNCYNALWGEEERINQDEGVVILTSPEVVVEGPPADVPASDEQETPTPTLTPGIEEPGSETPTPSSPTEVENPAPVTLCFFAEPTYAHINNAAFFDEAELIVAPPP